MVLAGARKPDGSQLISISRPGKRIVVQWWRWRAEPLTRLEPRGHLSRPRASGSRGGTGGRRLPRPRPASAGSGLTGSRTGRLYSRRAITCDLRRLRLNGLIERVAGSHRYLVTLDGWQVAGFCNSLNTDTEAALRNDTIESFAVAARYAGAH